MDKQKLVLIGNGMAGMHCIEEILENNPDLFNITIFGGEPYGNYNRILLSSVLQGGASFQDITINNRKWYEEHNIQLFTGETVVTIDIENKMIKTDKQREMSYDKLIIATGSVPFIPAIPGIDKEGVISFRTIKDCQTMIEASKQYKKAAVIGGGLLGLEAAKGLLNLGMEVNVVHISRSLMEKQLDATASNMLREELERQGMNTLLEKETEEIIGTNYVQGVRFKDGTEIEANLVVMAAGVRPNIQLAKESGIATNRAILVNDYLETSISDIYAVGECVEHQGMVYGLVKPLYEQGEVLAKHICGIECEGYKGSVLSTQLKISGVDVFSAGQFIDDETTKSIIIHDEFNAIYKKIVFQENKMMGAVLFGDTSDGSKLLNMILENKELSDDEKAELYQSSGKKKSSVTHMAHSDIICNCNAVTKGSIIEAVQQEGLATVEQVKKCTKASGSCGGCKPLVKELLTYIHSDTFDEVIEQKTMCSCTNLTEDQIVREIQMRNLISVQEVMESMNWQQSGGCPTCRGALNYYLEMIHPNFESKRDALFISECMNATRQSDGRYTIIPQIYGGIVTAQQLRKIANVVEKYEIPKMVVMSGQRIHLMGVKKEDLQDIWKDLNMPLIPLDKFRIQSVEIYINEEICPCDQTLSINLAVRLEKQLEYLKTPQRVKMSVAACIHNAEKAMTNDVGIIRIDRGWELYVGGSGGQDTRTGELLYVASSTEEAQEMAVVFIQYYRETANYLEYTGKWIERMGLIHIREVLFDRELRSQLLERLEQDSFKYKGRAEKSYI
ncbi:MAG TPA: nitrite reductase large subunit NirB [Chondromyces sp.]|nr:nitrite reductase large subunit NirB [Chondromyces sp.]